MDCVKNCKLEFGVSEEGVNKTTNMQILNEQYITDKPECVFVVKKLKVFKQL